jgi:SAM-dependent methyltransferase
MLTRPPRAWPDNAELRGYVAGSRRRIDAAVEMVAQRLAGRAEVRLLEVGRTPQDLMVRGLAPYLANDVGVVEVPPAVWPGTPMPVLEWVEPLPGAPHPTTFHIVQANIERDRLPWPADRFDVVLFCEVLEHLLYDPVHALVELGRILKPGGLLLVSTPNVLCWMNLVALTMNHNPRDLYSGYGPYGRHNREYSPAELSSLLQRLGYTIVDERQVYQAPATSSRLKPLVYALGGYLTRLPLPWLYRKHGNTFLTLARKAGVIRPDYPDWLFRSRSRNGVSEPSGAQVVRDAALHSAPTE